MHKSPVTLLLLGCLTLTACGPSAPDLNVAEEKALYLTTPNPSTPANWEKRAWIEKVARLLRGGRGLSPADPKLNLEQLVLKEKGEIIDLLLEEPLFGDAVLDFNLYFLGAKQDRVATDDHRSYNSAIFDYPQAISSAREVLVNGDYLKLLDYWQPIYVPALGTPYSTASPAPMPSPQPEEIRRGVYNQLQKAVDALITWSIEHPQATRKDFCIKFGEMDIGPYAFYSAGVISNLITRAAASQDGYGKLIVYCSLPNFIDAPVDLIAALSTTKSQYLGMIDSFKRLEKLPPLARDVRDIQVLETSEPIKELFGWNQFGEKQGRVLLNSSTNYNRKRGAYILKRFFCDDLTPIAVESPDTHVQDKHGADASCLSCHYKLDPMSGFFRNIGGQFVDTSRFDKIFFDDLAITDRKAYVAAWKAPVGASREWNVGYIRSVNKTELNDYGSNLEDLFAIIRKAPETRACIVRRMFEYFAGEDRMLDRGYLDDLVGGFNRLSMAQTSAAAFKGTLKRILLSHSFEQVNPEPGKCYDFAPGANPASSPPCAVAYVLQKNCIKCHSTTDLEFGNLDLAHWLPQTDGKFGFRFLDAADQPRPRLDAFKVIVDRLTTPDVEFRMPKGMHMSSADREQLYLWALKEAGL